ncbi:phage minor tail protein L, partial [Klebsiella pneumoniae]
MSLHADYQKLEPGDEIRLFEIDGSAFNMGDILHFHGYNITHTEAEIMAAGGDESKLPAKSIWWQGIEYKAWPCELEGIESSTSGSDAQPTLRVGNIDGSVSALCLHYDDLAMARVIIHDTQKQYLDARNFHEGNATADPTQEKRHLYFIDTKSLETDETVEFILSSPMD